MDPGGRPPDVEWLDDGPDEPLVPRPPGTPRRWLWWGGLSTVVTAALVITLVDRGGSRPAAAPSPAPSTSAPSTPAPPMVSTTPTPTPGPVVTNSRPLPGATGGWELFVRDAGAVYRIQAASGRITRTPIPVVGSNGPPVSFIVAPDQVIVRPFDCGAGYVVRDGQPARELAGEGTLCGQLYPGPDPRHMWAQASGAPPELTLVDLAGRPAGRQLPLPDGIWPDRSDDAGYVVATGVGGTYDVRPDGLHRITTGELTAIGPTRWLVLECDEQYRCAWVVVDRASGARTVLGTHVPVPGTWGVISPDGATAALLVPRANGTDAVVHLVDLTSGADRALPLTVDVQGSRRPLAWSPDSRWLYVAGTGGLVAVNARTGAGQAVRLPGEDGTFDVAVRPGAS